VIVGSVSPTDNTFGIEWDIVLTKVLSIPKN